MKVMISSTLYNFFIYILSNNDWKESVFFVDESLYKVFKKPLNKKMYMYENLSIKKSIYKFYFFKIKMIYLFFKEKIFFNKTVQFYGDDRLIYFTLRKQSFNIIEDGLINYQITKENKDIKTIIKKIIKLENPFYESFGYSKYVKKIYLTGLAPIPEEIKHKVEIINLKELWNKKTKKEKEEILDIFGFDEKIIENLRNKKKIIYTQPLSEDSVISEDEKIELYSKIIKNYNKKDLVLKKHPREKTDYRKIFTDIEILDQNFPAELFNLLDIKFDKVITIFSTAGLSNKKIDIDFYGTEIHPKILKKFGSHEHMMKRNAFIIEDKNE